MSCAISQINENIYDTVDKFKGDFNVMIAEAKALRTRHKEELVALEATEAASTRACSQTLSIPSVAPATAFCQVPSNVSVPRNGVASGNGSPAVAGETRVPATGSAGGNSVVSAGVPSAAEGGVEAARRAAAAAVSAVDRKRSQLERASQALDQAFLLKDTALSFLQR